MREVILLHSVPQWARKRATQSKERPTGKWERKVNKALRTEISNYSRKANVNSIHHHSPFFPFVFNIPFILLSLPKHSESHTQKNHSKINYKMTKDNDNLE